MALQQTIKIDSVDVVENGILQVRQRTDIFDDKEPKNIIASNYHRWTLCPGDDITGQEQKVINIANVTWTPEVIAAYKASLPQ
jgi:hypothetical protein